LFRLLKFVKLWSSFISLHVYSEHSIPLLENSHFTDLKIKKKSHWARLHLHANNNTRHPFFEPNCESIIFQRMWKNLTIFVRSVGHFSFEFVKNYQFIIFRFLFEMLNFAMLFVFRPKRILTIK